MFFSKIIESFCHINLTCGNSYIQNWRKQVKVNKDIYIYIYIYICIYSLHFLGGGGGVVYETTLDINQEH